MHPFLVLSFSFACVFVDHCFALLTFDIAAPNKLAMASVHVSHHLRVVAPPTAQLVAAAWLGRVLHTLSPSGADDVVLGVGAAVVGRPVDVHQLVPRDGNLPLLALSATEFVTA